MKLTIAVLALLCLGTAVNASSNAAHFKKLPLAGLLAGHAAGSASHILADSNITISDLMPAMPNMSDIQFTMAHFPKFQFPSLNVTGMGAPSWGNASDILVPLVPMLGLKAAHKALPLLPLLALFNHSAGIDINGTIPSLPSLNVSNVAVPLGALLALPKAHKALPLLPLLAALNVTGGFQVPSFNLSMPHLPSLNISDVAVPLGALLMHHHKGLPLLAMLGNSSNVSLPVFTSNVTLPLPLVGAVPFKALLGLKALLGPKHLPLLPLLGAAHLMGNVSDLAMSALAGLSANHTISAVPLGGLASLSKSVNISDLPLGAMLALGHKGLLAGMAGMLSNVTLGGGPSVDVSVRQGSVGMKNLAFNLTHPQFGIKPVALALNITHPELALKLAALNLSLPIPELRMGSRNMSVSVPMLAVHPQFGNMSVNVPMAALSMPQVDVNGSGDGNSTGLKFTKPGLSLGSANFTLPTLKPELALKLAQLGINVPTPEIGLKRATIGTALPMPDVQLAKKSVNLTLAVPDVSFKQFGVNLTVPDIQLPRLEFNVSGMPKLGLGLDALKSATLLSWLKDAGFYALKNATMDGNTTVIDLGHGHPAMIQAAPAAAESGPAESAPATTEAVAEAQSEEGGRRLL